MPTFKNAFCFPESMTRESFLLVSLKEEKAKKLAQVISNESCRKILDFLSNKESTETELAKKIGIPISTVHYNLRHLEDAGLVIAEEFHYSKKGREVKHYKLANKYIIIAPKTTFGIKEKLRSVLPVILILGAGAFAVQFATMRIGTFGSKTIAEAEPMAMAVRASVPAAASYLPMTLWFMTGAIAALALYFTIEYIRKRK
jgi:DNA-binding transcriptional ArsR family regulator